MEKVQKGDQEGIPPPPLWFSHPNFGVATPLLKLFDLAEVSARLRAQFKEAAIARKQNRMKCSAENDFGENTDAQYDYTVFPLVLSRS